MTLNWDTSYAIAIALKHQHPEVDLTEVSLKQIFEWTLQLQEFEDDLTLCNDDILSAICQEWYEELIHD